MKREWTIYLIHHSHTDIGYTERQDKIRRYHSDFICQAIDILNDIHAGRRKAAEGFVWQCENFWQVRNFYENAGEKYQRDFEKYVRSGEIGLSGNYLNMTELVPAEVLDSRIALAKQYGERIGRPVPSAMCADINGMAWGYADALYENGVEQLYTCIHPHHGMFPLYRKMLPFYWESPKGNRILVWNGDYYHLGNEMFFAPHGGNTYLIQDEYHAPMLEHRILNRSGEETEAEEREILRKRLARYLERLEEEGYPGSVVPFMVSGAITDNAPPSAGLAERVNQLEAEYQGRIHFRMVNLDQFFEAVKREYRNIPCYRGDFNDWWADGVGSTPGAVMIYLDARRKNHICRKLEADGGDAKLLEEAEENMMLYAEHTWGYSSSVVEPWEPMVGNLEWKKAGYAVRANTAASRNLDRLLAQRGEISIAQDKGQKYKILNPHGTAVEAPVCLYIEFWEYVEGVRFSPDIPIEVVDCASGQVIPSQVKQIARAYEVELVVSMLPDEEKEVRIVLKKDNRPATVYNHAYIGADGVEDLLQDGNRRDIGCMETGGYRITFDQKRGISSIYDKKHDRELLRPEAAEAAFSGIYEVTGDRGNVREVRRAMGRSRKTAATRRYYSRLTNIRVAEQGDVFTAFTLDYELEGCNFYQVYLKIYEMTDLIEARVRVHKKSIWDPENLYIALPFTAGEGSVTWIDKTGCILRPGIDQLPGTGQDFYLVQNGVVWEGQDGALVLATKNAPLIAMGDLQAGPVRLCNGEDTERNGSRVYSWVMNNYWETNFKAETGGFYEFTYRLFGTGDKSVQETFSLCEAQNEGLPAFYIKAE